MYLDHTFGLDFRSAKSLHILAELGTYTEFSLSELAQRKSSQVKPMCLCRSARPIPKYTGFHPRFPHPVPKPQPTPTTIELTATMKEQLQWVHRFRHLFNTRSIKACTERTNWTELNWIASSFASCSARSTQPGRPSVGRRNEYQRKLGRKPAHRAMH